MLTDSRKLLLATLIATAFGILSVIIGRLICPGADAACTAVIAFWTDAVAYAVVIAACNRDRESPSADKKEAEADDERSGTNTVRSLAIVVGGVLLFGAAGGAFYAGAGIGYLPAGLVIGLITSLYVLMTNLDALYRPALLLSAFMAESFIIVFVTTR